MGGNTLFSLFKQSISILWTNKNKTKKAVLNLSIYNTYIHIYIIYFPINSAGTNDFCLYHFDV